MSFPSGTLKEQQEGVTVEATTSNNTNPNHQIHSNDPSGSSDNSSSSHSTTVSPGSAETTASSTTGTTNWKPGQSQQHNHPYRNILTHQERKKLRMPKRKADSWPASILADPDVLSLDDEGRFVLCKVCHVHYAVHGGKKPKPVIMNSSFRTRAWDVHKERTNSHRMQKKQGDHCRQPHAPPSSAMAADENEQKVLARDTKSHSTESSASAQQQMPQPQQQQHQQAAQTQMQQGLADEQQQVRFAPPAPRSQQGHSPLGRPEFISAPPPSPHRRMFRASSQLSAHQWQPSDHDMHRRNIHASAHDHHRLNADLPATSVVAAAAGTIGSASLPAVSLTTTSSSAHGRKTNASMASEQVRILSCPMLLLLWILLCFYFCCCNAHHLFCFACLFYLRPISATA